MVGRMADPRPGAGRGGVLGGLLTLLVVLCCVLHCAGHPEEQMAGETQTGPFELIFCNISSPHPQNLKNVPYSLYWKNEDNETIPFHSIGDCSEWFCDLLTSTSLKILTTGNASLLWVELVDAEKCSMREVNISMKAQGRIVLEIKAESSTMKVHENITVTCRASCVSCQNTTKTKKQKDPQSQKVPENVPVVPSVRNKEHTFTSSCTWKQNSSIICVIEHPALHICHEPGEQKTPESNGGNTTWIIMGIFLIIAFLIPIILKAVLLKNREKKMDI